MQRAILTGKIELEPEAQGMTITEAIKEFFAEHESRGAAEGTIKSFRKFLGDAPNRNKIDLSKVSPTLPDASRVRSQRWRSVPRRLLGRFYREVPPIVESQPACWCQTDGTTEELLSIRCRA